MNTLKFQLNTPVEITRDLAVEVEDQVTGRKFAATPFLDGTVNLRNLTAGNYRVKVRHPNLPFPVVDRPIKVLPGGPTFVPITVDLSMFQNTPVRDIAEADLAPVRAQLEEAGDAAERQAAKRGGEPIYAADWNTLAGTVNQVTAATVDLTRRVSATGHDHPELIEKLDEIQANMQRFLEVFGQAMAQIQRQIQELALQQRADRALDAIPGVTPAQRAEVTKLVENLGKARNDNSYLYLRELRRTGEAITTTVADLLPAGQPDVGNQSAVVQLVRAAEAMAQAAPAASIEEEVKAHLRVDRVADTGGLASVVRGAGRQ